MKENKILANSRIRIRPLQIEDALDYANLRNEDFVRRYNVLEFISEEEAEEIIRNCEDEEGWGIELSLRAKNLLDLLIYKR